MKSFNLRMPLQKSEQRDWWIKIQTKVPACTYYFGPFSSQKEARNSQTGYIDDLRQEGAQEIAVEIGKAAPKQLTVYGLE